MNRMEKYEEENKRFLSRTAKNENMYSALNDVDLSRIKTNNNVSVISEATKQIDIEKIKRYLEHESDGEVSSRTFIKSPQESTKEILVEDEKDYDILSVLQRAKADRINDDYNKQKHRKINEFDLEILRNFNLESSNNDVNGEKDLLNTEEKTIVDLIHNFAKKSNKDGDLFEELMNGNEDTKILPINSLNDEEILNSIEQLDKDEKDTKQSISEKEYEKLCMKAVNGKLLSTEEFTKIEQFDKLHYDKKENDVKVEKIDPQNKKTMPGVDKSFFTSSMSFSKDDFENFDELEKKVKKSSILTKLSIVFMLLILVATTVVVANYIFELGWF